MAEPCLRGGTRRARESSKIRPPLCARKHVYPLPRRPMRQVPFSVELDFVPLGEMAPVSLAKRFCSRYTGPRDRWREIASVDRARVGRPQHVSEPPEQAIQSAHRKRRVSLGKTLGVSLRRRLIDSRRRASVRCPRYGVLPGPVLFERDEVMPIWRAGTSPKRTGMGGRRRGYSIR